MKTNIEKLEVERKKMCLSKGDFAQIIGVSPAYYSGVLGGRVSTLKVITRMAERLKIDPKELLVSVPS
jgi:transcriptional regulator with XRE-family HTH domain